MRRCAGDQVGAGLGLLAALWMWFMAAAEAVVFDVAVDVGVGCSLSAGTADEVDAGVVMGSGTGAVVLRGEGIFSSEDELVEAVSFERTSLDMPGAWTAGPGSPSSVGRSMSSGLEDGEMGEVVDGSSVEEVSATSGGG